MVAGNRARKAILDTGNSSVTPVAGTCVLEKPLKARVPWSAGG